MVFAASAARSSSAFAVMSREGIFIPERALRPSDMAYFRPFRPLVWSRRPIWVRSWAADPEATARETAPPPSGFDCFGFFASRFDRFCPFAIAASCYC
jgi:hypothetical protein